MTEKRDDLTLGCVLEGSSWEQVWWHWCPTWYFLLFGDGDMNDVWGRLFLRHIKSRINPAGITGDILAPLTSWSCLIQDTDAWLWSHKWTSIFPRKSIHLTIHCTTLCPILQHRSTGPTTVSLKAQVRRARLFSIFAPMWWNKLPLDVQTDVFKKQLNPKHFQDYTLI